MMFRGAMLAGVFACLSSIAMAQTGTREEKTACRSDVRKFCYKIPQSAGNQAFRYCLLSNRNILSLECQKVLIGH